MARKRDPLLPPLVCLMDVVKRLKWYNMLRAVRARLSLSPATYVPCHFDPARRDTCPTATYRRLEAAVVQDEQAAEKKGWYALPKPDFPLHGGVPPVWSPAQARYVHDVHHRSIVDGLNEACFGTEYESMPLDVVIRSTSFDATRAMIHQRACEHFNHAFAIKSIKPWGVEPPLPLQQALDIQLAAPGAPFGTAFKDLQLRLHEEADQTLEVPGWVFLIWRKGQFHLQVCQAGTSLLSQDVTPLMCINTQYTSFFIDYGHDKRAEYISNCIKAIDWSFVARNWKLATSERGGIEGL